MVDDRFGKLGGDEIRHQLPERGGDTVDCDVISKEFDFVENDGDPGVGLSVLDGVKGFAKCELTEY